jgi:threonine dehydrogenase-like Zn-dependent dehydrogenase
MYGRYAEYARVPLENTYPLDEVRLTKALNLPLPSILYIARLLVPMGGLSDLDVKPGETVIVCPSTGNFGAGGVEVALAMGCNVIAAGRTASSLEKLAALLEKRASGRLTTVTISGKDVGADTAALVKAAGGKPIDAFLDLSPAEAKESTHIQSVIGAIRPFGRIALMGGIQGNVGLPYAMVMAKSLRIMGRFMYEREHVGRLIAMAECGVLPLGEVRMKEVGLERWEEAFRLAEDYAGLGQGVVIRS